MLSQYFMALSQLVLILLIACATLFIAYHIFRTNILKQKADIYERRLKVYREVIRILTLITQDGDISQNELTDFRSKTHESGFLFRKDLVAYVEEIYERSAKLRSTTALLKGPELPVGEQRDKVTIENSAHMIWLTGQLPLVKKKFEKYLSVRT